MKLKVSIYTNEVDELLIGAQLLLDGRTKRIPIGNITALERDSDEFSIVTIDIADDDAELFA